MSKISRHHVKRDNIAVDGFVHVSRLVITADLIPMFSDSCVNQVLIQI